MSPEEPEAAIEVDIRGKTVRVPLYDNAEATERLAARLGKRFDAIEKKWRKIDDMGNALRLAFALAVEIEELKLNEQSAEAEIAKALDKLQARLQKLAEPGAAAADED